MLPGVYAPQDDTVLLAGALRREVLPPRARVLDVGTGTGVLAVAAARRGARVTAVDISRSAVWTARLNALLARTPVRVLRGDLTAPVEGCAFDLVVANPPYVPSPGPPGRGAARAWDAGRDGRLVLDRICGEVPGLLRPGGVLLLVHSALSGERATLARLRSAGLRTEVTERRQVALGPVLRSRRVWLCRRGLLSPGGQREELVVIRAERTR
ncbi:HemK2/MTQ2 family protein methyltransferase [Streptomyces sp. WMMC940]|uniref:HemK2/MTQ2 family protein methyltransferase n=1 Tax=Streptomyces sp. WMMC940 TaxID=3015153 RepID=UPI0022B7146E|nr:HemK2/MTQ2 family protein methyltransferase [Streptomyces sp. WMMC940]MCZ7461813.1 methyltransferase [Streptomyces sp. WMMC940]